MASTFLKTALAAAGAYVFLLKHVEAAARSVDITLFNGVGASMTLMATTINHGILTKDPPTMIHGAAAASWKAESDGFMTGTEGSVTYTLQNKGNVFIYWDNPFAGSNDYKASAPDGCNVERVGGDGNNAQVSFTVTCDSYATQTTVEASEGGSSQVDSSAARSVDISLYNGVGASLKLMSFTANHGIASTDPPQEILGGSAGAWSTESNGFMTGTEGSVTYSLASRGNVYIYWNNPYVGSNEYKASAPQGCSILKEGGEGNNAQVSLTLTCDS